MQIFHTLEKFRPQLGPVILTIGNFDGIHLGHQKVIQKVVDDAKNIKGIAAVITFSNHPLEVLKPEKPLKFLCTPKHKEKLLQSLGVDALFNLLFTKEFSEQDPETFLVKLKSYIDYRKIILGYDAKIGKDREGDKETIAELAHKMDFEIEHLAPLLNDELPVSSSIIRESVKKGDFETAKKVLGRRYSILSTVIQGKQKGRHLGYPTANLDVSQLCLPPYGVYTVEVEYEGSRCLGIANIGIAPSTRDNINPVLEVYLFEGAPNLYGKEIEVFFGEYLRPEIKFSSVEELRSQIAKDVEQAKSQLGQRSGSGRFD